MKLALVALCVIGTSQAWAQSKKYPPVTPDKELEEEKRSELWESTLHPDTGPYRDLVREAKRLVEGNSADDRKVALEKLDVAIKRMPREPDAYQVRGQIFLALKDWPRCADDLGRAEDYTKTIDDLTARTRSRIDLANCQARAGRYSEAESTLVRASASAQAYRSELYMRLGEVRIALGKLDEAIDALTVALDGDSTSSLTRWLLMSAYDRARRPSEALEHAQQAIRYDPQRSHIDHPSIPLLGTDEADYLSGLAYRYAFVRPEYALLYFRRFVKLAPDSPWRRRADEHVKELSAMRFPARETITNSGTTVVPGETQKLLQKPVAAMRHCLAKLPTTAFQIATMKAGPRTSESVRDRPIYRLPSPPKPVTLLPGPDTVPQAEIDAAQKCLEGHAARLNLPAPKERDTYYIVSFIVVAP